MPGVSEIVHVELSDGDSRFQLDALLWGEPGDADGHLLLSVEIETAAGEWRSKATSVVARSVSSVAATASDAGAGRDGIAMIDYADPTDGACLAFSFRLREDGRVEVAVVVDVDLPTDEPVHPEGRLDYVLLRVRPEEVIGFAEALEAIARRDTLHFAWAG